jgi:hypothetical protein
VIIGHDVSDVALASAAARDRRLFVVTDDSVVACECAGWDLAAAQELAKNLETETDAPPPPPPAGELTCSEPPTCQGFVFSGTARSVYDRRGRRSVDDACIPKQ